MISRRCEPADYDRQQVVEQLRSALEDGRLTMEEYVDRMEVAYQAATYGDLAPLCADLPASSPVIARPQTAAAAAAPPAVLSRAGYLVGLPAVLKVLWTIWLAVVSINVVIWTLVQRHRWSPGLPLASLGCRSVRGSAVRRLGWRHAIPAQPTARRAPAAGEWLTRSGLPACRSCCRGAHGDVVGGVHHVQPALIKE